MKLNVLLAKVESSTPVFRKLISDYKLFFDKKQDEFKGVKKTYTPREGTKDEPSMRENKQVVTTVKEKLEYLEDHGINHLDNLMNIEATNASGNAKFELVVMDGDRPISFGELSTLELMKLKSILEKEGLETMYASIPVRSDSEIWEISDKEEHTGRDIYQSPMQTGVSRSIRKEEYILEDPNLKHMTDTSRYTPVKAVKDTPLDLGDYTLQKFSGESTHRFRAGILSRRSKLLEAVNAALKAANDAQVVSSNFSAQQLFDYLHGNIPQTQSSSL